MASLAVTEEHHWRDRITGGQYTFDQSSRALGREGTEIRNRPLTVHETNTHLRETLAGGKWQIVLGWHVLRQSFLANRALGGVKPRMIEVLMGRLSAGTRRRC